MSRWIIGLVLVLIAAWFLFPPLLTLEASFMHTFGIMNPIKAIPRMHLENWRYLPYNLIGTWAKNSFIVCSIATILTTLLCALAGFGFAKHDFPGKKLCFWLFLLAMMMPVTLLFLPRFLITRNLGMYNSYAGMIVPALVYPAGVFFARQYISGIPDDLTEAARMDGASEFQIFRYIITPLSLPLLAILVLFSFVNVWQQFMWQYLIARDAEIQTLMVGLGAFLRGIEAGGVLTSQGVTTVNIEGLRAAMSIILAIPPMLIFLIGQKYFLQGLKIGRLE